MITIFDCEVFAYDWLFVFKQTDTQEYAVFHNDNSAVREYLEQTAPMLCGFNNKHYDQFVLKAVLANATPYEIKQLSEFIIRGNNIGWQHPLMQQATAKIDQFDLMDDCQTGLSLKAIEAHLGMDIRESIVDFTINRPLTAEEVQEVIFYCKHDVDATERLYSLRKSYLDNKIMLGRMKGIPDTKSLYMTNAKLTAAYLDAVPAEYNDERRYVYPNNLLTQYIPQEVFAFFNRIYDDSLSDEEIFKSKLTFYIGACEVTVAYGGIHGAIPHYREKAGNGRHIRNKDVGSYYPHLMTLDHYCSRAIPNPKIYEEMLEKRMAAKKSGNKPVANALKLVANTTYGAMLSQYNPLYDPLMGRSVCITGQLRLLELAMHLVAECPTIIIIQLNTDGIMISLGSNDLEKYNEICNEWQSRTGFTLEEDEIAEIIQKDVNNYIEIATDGKTKIKGGQLVRGVSPAGAFNVNNNAPIVPKAIIAYLVDGKPIKDTINACDNLLDFQLVAKASGLYSTVDHIVNGQRERVQKCNRVYATKDKKYGTLIKTHASTGGEAKIAGLPEHCIIDNNNELTIDILDKSWYIRLAKRQADDFLGIEQKKADKKKLKALQSDCIRLLEE